MTSIGNVVDSDFSLSPSRRYARQLDHDRLCCTAMRFEELRGQAVDRLHFDEARYGDARFNLLYRDRHAMHGDPKVHDPKGPTVFTTESSFMPRP